MLAIVLLCLVSFVVSQPPRPCVTPQRWEAFVYDYNDAENVTVRGSLSYDAVNRRERFLERVDVDRDEDTYDVIALFNEQREYVYDFRSNNCTSRPLTRPWRDFGIPPGSRPLGEGFVGSVNVPDGNLFVTFWATGTERESLFGTWTYRDCLPVRLVRQGALLSRSQTQFFNITPNIKNDSVFTPRKQCLQQEDVSLKELVFGKQQMAKL